MWSKDKQKVRLGFIKLPNWSSALPTWSTRLAQSPPPLCSPHALSHSESHAHTSATDRDSSYSSSTAICPASSATPWPTTNRDSSSCFPDWAAVPKKYYWFYFWLHWKKETPHSTLDCPLRWDTHPFRWGCTSRRWRAWSIMRRRMGFCWLSCGGCWYWRCVFGWER